MRKGWEYKKLGEVGTFLRGKNILKSDFVEKGLPCIHYGQIHTKFGISTDTHLTETSQEVYDKAIIASKNDVLIAITSEDLEGSCKATAWLGDYDVAVSAHAAVFKHNLNPKYIVYYLKSQSFYIEKSKYARGFKVMEIKPTDIAKIPIPIPPKSTQLAIVSELDKINELIRLKKEQLKDFDNLAQSLFYEMFGDPVENEKGWEVKKLGEICEVTSAKRVFIDEVVESGVPFIRGTELTALSKLVPGEKMDYTLFITYEHYERLKAITGVPKIGDLLIPSINADGIVWMVDTEDPLYFKDGRVLWVHVNHEYYNSIAIQKLMNVLIKNVFTSMGGATFAELKLFVLRNMNVPIPPLSVQDAFSEKIKQIDAQKLQVKKSIQDLETLLASRMQYWFE